MKKIIITSIFILLISSGSVFAKDSAVRSTVFAPIKYGARALGMGGAYTALSDDASGVMWNPAGIGYMRDRQLSAMYANLYGINKLNNSFISFAQPDKGMGAGSIFMTNTTLVYGVDENQYSETMIGYTYAKRMGRLTSLGFTLKGLMVRSDADLGDAGGFGFDVGVTFRPFADAAFGLAIKDAYSDVKWDGNKREKLPMQFRTGIAAMPVSVPGLVTTVDLAGDEDAVIYDLALGAEYTVLRVAALRAGFCHIFPDESRNLLSFGFGVLFYSLQLNYAYTNDDTLDSTHRFDLNIKF